MTHRDDLLRRVTAANPVPSEVDLPKEVVDARPPLAVLIKEEKSGMTGSQHRVALTRLDGMMSRPWAKPATVFAAVFVLILAAIGIVAILTSGQPEFVEGPPPTTTVQTATTITATTDALVPPIGAWNPILATTRAKPAPSAATCPPDADPNAPGTTGERPSADWYGNLKGVFDLHTGRIVFDTGGQTWTFDVCTNTWQRMNPVGTTPGALSAGMVYDVDSDVTVAFGHAGVYVYDAPTNSWTQQPNEEIGLDDDRLLPMGAVYDPISGLMLTTRQIRWDEPVEEAGFWELWAYDVDTDTWTVIGTIGHQPTEAERWGNDGQWLELLGYSSTLDRLIFSSGNEETVLVDPRTGGSVALTTETPVIDLLWPGGVYGPAGDTVYVKQGGQDICGFDTSSLTWSDCFEAPTALQGNQHIAFAAMVGDPVDQRLVLISSVGGDWWSEATDDVWAVDLDTGTWTQLVAPSTGPCQWLTDEVIAEAASAAFGSLGVTWQGTATIDKARTNNQNCTWVLTSASTPEEDGVVWLGRSRDWVDPDPRDVIDYSGDPPTTDSFVAGYPGLDDGVLVRAGAFESYDFWIRGTDTAMALVVELGDERGAIGPTIIVANRILEATG